MLWTEEQARALEAPVVRASLVFRLLLNTGEVIRLWSGVGALQIDTDLVELDGSQPYYGAGEIKDFPAVQQLINGEAERIDFRLAGPAIDGRVVQLADDESEKVRQARLNIGVVIFDADWQIALPVRWIWEGSADSLDISAVDQAGERVRSLTLSVGSIFSGRKRAAGGYLTDADQQRESAGDRFCERVNLYSQSQPKPWPRV